MAENDPNRENRERALEAGRAVQAESYRQFEERTKGKPTPTQEENDRAALGEHIVEHEPDGGDPDEGAMPIEMRQRHLQPGQQSGQAYRTRQAQPQQPHREQQSQRLAPKPPSSS